VHSGGSIAKHGLRLCCRNLNVLVVGTLNKILEVSENAKPNIAVVARTSSSATLLLAQKLNQLHNLQSWGHPRRSARSPSPPREIEFDFSAGEEYLTGFHKREVARQKFAQDDCKARERGEARARAMKWKQRP
jgi:hypothetical protein